MPDTSKMTAEQYAAHSDDPKLFKPGDLVEFRPGDGINEYWICGEVVDVDLRNNRMLVKDANDLVRWQFLRHVRKAQAHQKPPLKPGDVVQLKSGGVPMTVIGIYPAQGSKPYPLIHVSWVDSTGKLWEQDLPEAAFKPVDAKSPSNAT